MAAQGLIELGDLGFERLVSKTLQQLMHLRQTAPQARLVGFPSHLEMSLVVTRAVVGEAEKRQRLRPFPLSPCLALGKGTERHEVRFRRLEGSSAFRQALGQDLLEALRVCAVLETHDENLG